MCSSSVSKATLGRVPQYLGFLKELPLNDFKFVSATYIAKGLNLGEVLVRKDLNILSGGGKPKLGYVTEELIQKLEVALGNSCITSAILVGAGKLGKALLNYDGFEKFGVKIVAAFDCNEDMLGNNCGVEILPIDLLNSFCTINKIHLGIITVSEGAAQAICDQMISCGISAIWNFAPCKLNVPNEVLLQNENLALSLAYLNNKLCNSN